MSKRAYAYRHGRVRSNYGAIEAMREVEEEMAARARAIQIADQVTNGSNTEFHNSAQLNETTESGQTLDDLFPTLR